jgi:hypothetical protein
MYLVSGLRERIEFPSSQKWGAWPLVYVSLGGIGPDGKYFRGRARGVIAVGDTATGIKANGGVARSIFAVGSVAVGIVALGALWLGVVVLGGLAVGMVCSGGLPVGSFPATDHGLSILELPAEWTFGVLAGFSVPGYLFSVGFDRLTSPPNHSRIQ